MINRVKSILKNNIVKDINTHLVVSRYKENVDWINKINKENAKIIVYNKYEGSNRLPNIGRESHTYLHHIINNYYNLPDFLIFSQGNPFAHGAGEKIIKTINEKSFQLSYSSFVSSLYPTGYEKIQVFANNLFNKKALLCSNFYQAACFSVTKNDILNNSIDFYEKCIATLTTINPVEGHYFERLWETIFTKQVEGPFNENMILNKTFMFGQMKKQLGEMEFSKNGVIDIYNNSNERKWIIENGYLYLLNSNGFYTSKFYKIKDNAFIANFEHNKDWHKLELSYDINWNDTIVVKKQNGVLNIKVNKGIETRMESLAKLIKLTDQKYNLPDFKQIIIENHDTKLYKSSRVLSPITTNDDYSLVCPDFVFDNWGGAKMMDYEETCKELTRLGSFPPKTNALGWRGANTNGNRVTLTKLNDDKIIDAKFITWADPKKYKDLSTRPDPQNFVSVPDHAKLWRYLIDIEGYGYSGRLKMFFFSKRVIFLVDRPYKEWFYQYLEPWKHYIPVKRNLSNLLEQLDIIKNDTKLEQYINESAFEFAQKYLTRDAALARFKELLI